MKDTLIVEATQLVWVVKFDEVRPHSSTFTDSKTINVQHYNNGSKESLPSQRWGG